MKLSGAIKMKLNELMRNLDDVSADNQVQLYRALIRQPAVKVYRRNRRKRRERDKNQKVRSDSDNWCPR